MGEGAKKIVAAAVACFGVFIIFLGIGYVVKGPTPDVDSKERMDLSFLRTIRSSELNERERKKPKTPPKAEKQPEVPKPKVAKMAKPQNTPMKMDISALDMSLDLGSGPYIGGVGAAASTGAADSDMVPIVKVNPQYPRQAAMKGQEGYVRMRIDIKPDGTVTNVRVVDSNPRRVFDRAAVRAAAKYRYKPPIVDGKPQTVKGHGVQIDFKLSGAS